MTLGKVFFFLLRKRISPVNIILPMLHTHLHLHAELSRRTNAGSLEAFNSNAFTGIRGHWVENNFQFLTFQKVYQVWVADDYSASQEVTNLYLLAVCKGPLCSAVRGIISGKSWYRLTASSGVPMGGGVWGVQTRPPRNSEGPPKNRAKLNPIVKNVKQIAEFRTPTPQDVLKKCSKILKLPRFTIVLH